MNTFRNDLQDLVSRHVARAPTQKLLRLVESLGSEEPAAAATETSDAVLPRFINLNAVGKPAAEGAEWVAVYDTLTQLTWTRQVLDCGAVPHEQAMAAASAVRLFGHDDWRPPTIQEQLSIIDYTRCEPALDTAHFDGPADWCWTSTVAKHPAGCAWFVDLSGGGSYRAYQSNRGHVRAVRAGQSLELGI
jgi:hypothetical protein